MDNIQITMDLQLHDTYRNNFMYSMCKNETLPDIVKPLYIIETDDYNKVNRYNDKPPYQKVCSEMINCAKTVIPETWW